MRVFMLGWEFPPYISGGLGTACFGLTIAANVPTLRGGSYSNTTYRHDVTNDTGKDEKRAQIFRPAIPFDQSAAKAKSGTSGG